MALTFTQADEAYATIKAKGGDKAARLAGAKVKLTAATSVAEIEDAIASIKAQGGTLADIQDGQTKLFAAQTKRKEKIDDILHTATFGILGKEK